MTDETIEEYGLDGEPIQVVDAELDESSDSSEYPQEEIKSVQEAVVSLEWLCDLKQSIHRNGVSQNDIRSLDTIRSDLMSKGFEFEACPALESYNINAYTDDATTINLDVALESFGQTIINVIKSMIRKLVEFITKIVRWFRDKLMNDRVVDIKIERAVRRVTTLREKNDQFAKTYGAHPELSKLLAKTRYDLLTNKGLVYTFMTDAMFNDKKMEIQANTLFDAIPTALSYVQASALRLANVLDPKSSDGEVVAFDFNAFNDLASSLFLMEVPHADPIKALEKLGGTSVIRKPLSPFLTEVTHYTYIVEVYEKVNDALKKINRFSSEWDYDPIVEYLKELTQASDTMAKIANHIYTINARKLKILGLMYSYEKIYYTELFTYAKERYKGTAKEALINTFAKQVTKIIEETLK